MSPSSSGSSRHSDGWRALLIAACCGNVEETARLLDGGLDPDAVNKGGMSALHFACCHGHLDVVRVLVKGGANVHLLAQWAPNNAPTPLAVADAPGASSDHLALTPLGIAAACGHSDIVDFLAPVDTATQLLYEKLPPLMWAAGAGHLAVVQAMIAHGGPLDQRLQDGCTALAMAVTNGHLAVVRALHEAGCEVDPPCTPPVVYRAAAAGHGAVVLYLLRHGARFEWLNAVGFSSLCTAAFKGHLSVVEAFVSFGIPADGMRTSLDSTALHCAAYARNFKIVKYLITNGAPVDYRCAAHVTPLQAAVEGGSASVVQYLLDHNASFPRHSPLVGARLLHVEVQFPWSAFQNHNTTLLHVAAQLGHEPAVAVLLKTRMAIDAGDSFGRTPLRIASDAGHVTVMRQLMEAQADVNVSDKFAISPLLSASHRGQDNVVQVLVESQADLNHVDRRGWSALHNAAARGHQDIVRYLVRRVGGLQFLLTGRLDSSTRSWAPPPAMVAAQEGQDVAIMHLLGALSLLRYRVGPLALKCSKVALKANHEELGQLLGQCADWTPLHFFSSADDLASAKELLCAGSDPLHDCPAGFTPLGVARSPAMGALLRNAATWSPAAHGLFPPAFRRAMHWLLLAWHRGGIEVPIELWLAALAHLPRGFRLLEHSAPLQAALPQQSTL